jgi:hypothetical protein
MNPNHIKDVLRAAVQNMIREDFASSPARALLNTAERNITARLREQLSPIVARNMSTSYQVDHEYNRVGAEGNSPKFSKILNQNVIPDIAIHMRGIRREQNPKANLIIIEVKIITSFDGTLESIRNKRQRAGLEDDLMKVEALRSMGDQYGYLHGASMVFSKSAVWIRLDDESFELLMGINEQ